MTNPLAVARIVQGSHMIQDALDELHGSRGHGYRLELQAGPELLKQLRAAPMPACAFDMNPSRDPTGDRIGDLYVVLKREPRPNRVDVDLHFDDGSFRRACVFLGER